MELILSFPKHFFDFKKVNLNLRVSRVSVITERWQSAIRLPVWEVRLIIKVSGLSLEFDFQSETILERRSGCSQGAWVRLILLKNGKWKFCIGLPPLVCGPRIRICALIWLHDPRRILKEMRFQGWFVNKIRLQRGRRHNQNTISPNCLIFSLASDFVHSELGSKSRLTNQNEFELWCQGRGPDQVGQCGRRIPKEVSDLFLSVLFSFKKFTGCNLVVPAGPVDLVMNRPISLFIDDLPERLI